MNSRGRVMAALNHEEPDMVPLDLGGNQSGIHMIAYNNLLEFLNIEDKTISYSDFIQQSAKPCEELLQRLEIDVRWL
ncbi:MAG: methyltransferase, partial [Promethearchaeota archaeon]